MDSALLQSTPSVPSDADAGESNALSIRRQSTILILLNLLFLTIMFLMHLTFSSAIGTPSIWVFYLIVGRFIWQLAELIWLQRTGNALVGRRAVQYQWGSVIIHLLFTYTLATVADLHDTHYHILMLVPILSAAFNFGIVGVISVVSMATALNFVQLTHYYHRHPPIEWDEYIEAATMAMVNLLVGIVTWLISAQLGKERYRLAMSLQALKAARDNLVNEEKLAAVGRLASGIAHEIRNPVAMISSSLELVDRSETDAPTREEMFNIARQEAKRLESLTTDFLAYARTRTATFANTPALQLLQYIASLCGAKAKERQMTISVRCPEDLAIRCDRQQIEQALLNLLINAIDGSPASGEIRMIGEQRDKAAVLAVENAGTAIPLAEAARIFEPFFTTKQHGTGLGLAIARNIARANKAELILARNESGRIRFEIIFQPSSVAGLVHV